MARNEMNLSRGEARKEDGMRSAALRRRVLLNQARQAVIKIAAERPSREATSDDCTEWLIDEQELPSSALGPAQGSLFKTDDWEWTGRMVKSRKATNHAALIGVWRLK